ncbi:MAG TPA: DUF502 domain-containing protein [Elusimicrobiota bacterium]|nr:DUF502 domain-containing protein [Elusimicrobiota bacterium]
MWNNLKKHFFAGLIIFVPLSLTVYFFRLLFLVMSQSLLPVVTQQKIITLHPAIVRPMSFLLTIFLIWGLGVVGSNFVGKRLVRWLESGIRHIPFFRGLYEAIQKVTEAFFGAHPIYQSAILVEYPRRGVYTFGFVTSEISGAVFHTDELHYCVFIPTVPNPTSGILLYIPQSEAIPLNISIEEVAKILVSHGFVKITEGAVKALGRK